MKKSFLSITLFFFLLLGLHAQTRIYKDSKFSYHERTLDLISQMTLDEKIGQLLSPLGWEMYDKKDHKTVTFSKQFLEEQENKKTGMFWAVFRADPWTQKTLINGLNPKLAAMASNDIQRYVMENSRLGIPIFIAEEAPHGHMAIGATVFPTSIGMAATFNTELMEKVGAVLAKEVRLQGAHISYGPVLDVTRDPRWSRVEETFGEDPVLTGAMGAAYVKGAGGGDLSKPYSTISTLKHFVAYGIPEGGHNGNIAHVGERTLRSVFMPPFKAAIDAGALSVMSSYNAVDGVPCTANKYLLTDVLRNEWGFKGFVVSDLISIDILVNNFRIAKSLEDAAALALKAGVDVDLGSNAFSKLADALKNKKVSEMDIDKALYRVLKLKFDMGLFDNPYVDPNLAEKGVRTSEHITLAREAAQQTVVLLENKNNILPLNKNLKKVAVIGPNADTPYNQLGDYTAPQEEGKIKTVLDGVIDKLGKNKVEYAKGCAIRDVNSANIEEAVEVAKRSDVAIVVVGGSSARDFKTEYIATGAAVTSKESVADMESGEGFDRATLDLLGKQLDLLKAIKATGKPMIVVYIEGRPLNMNWASENADALLTAWYPGQEGGSGIADVLFGDYNPAGRLPISVPRSVGQLPVYYNRTIPLGHDYIEESADPLYPFGYGLSYTTFDYKNLKTVQRNASTFDIEFTLTNTGKRDGDEVVQLYLRDEYASVALPIKQLKQFSRINLKAGESKQVRFTLTEDDLSIIDAQMNSVVEPGTFQVMIGSSSDNIKLDTKIEVK